ncbi:hypothetical protein EWI07_00205 [Sporolactobacillus sp. THM7-4]|nr:hypothetical protein EWI07_00205 [Sporolactobacillus sp. THM7-4]
MSVRDYFMIVIGVLLIPGGCYIIVKRKVTLLPKIIMHRIRSIGKFSVTLGTIITLTGMASILSPVLTGTMGSDFWILYFLGIFACLMLLITFFLN